MIAKPALRPIVTRLDSLSDFHLIRESPQPNNLFLGSASVVVHQGEVLIGSDTFGAGATPGTSAIDVFDEVSLIATPRLDPFGGMYWGRFLDFDPNILHMWGTSQENGNIVLASSVDSGGSWTKTTLFNGNFACAPTNYLIHNGYVLVTMEDVQVGAGGPVNSGRPKGTRVYRCSLDQDLHDPDNWEQSNLILFNSGTFGGFEILEFSLVKHGEEIFVYGRTLYATRMAKIKYDFDTNTLSDETYINHPLGWCKFHYLKCPFTGGYLVAGNEFHAPYSTVDEDRTWIYIQFTRDFVTFTKILTIVDYGEGYYKSKGIQYPYLYTDGVHPTLYIGLRIGEEGNTPHNSNQIRLGIYPNYPNLIPSYL